MLAEGRADGVGVEAASVVGDVDAQAVAGQRHADGEGRAGRLAALGADGGRLDAMIDRIAHEVQDRVAESSEHGAVGLHLRAEEDEVDFLAELEPQVADDAWQRLEDIGDRT